MNIKIILFLLIVLFRYNTINSQVEIIAGKGIVFKNDSIIIHKTSTEALSKILKIKDTTEINQISISEYDSIGNFIYDFFIKSVYFDEFEFQFSGYKKEEMLLRNIYIDMSESNHSFQILNAKILNTSVGIVKKFSKSISKEMDSGETKSLSVWSTSGITFLLDPVKKKILKICVNEKYKI